MRGVAKVVLLVETSRGFGRGLLRGIVRYSRLHGPWAFYITPGDLVQVLPKMGRWGATGIIARVEDTARATKTILETGLPVIALDLSAQQLASGHPLAGTCEICPNGARIGQMAAEYFLEKGFHHFAFAGVARDALWAKRREEGFLQRLTEAGYDCSIHRLPEVTRDRHWDRQLIQLKKWLQSLPKPVAVLACDDDRGREVLEACQDASLAVPEDVAVLGVDNDELLCEISDPPLSSIALDTQRGGYEAAAALDRLMAGQPVSNRRILVEPTRVVSRRSTDVFALQDRPIAMAVRFINDHVRHSIGVIDVMRYVGLSRRTLEVRFRKVMGRSVLEEITRSRLERARHLLLETDLPIQAVAESVGLKDANYLARVFHRETGMSPTAFRRHNSLTDVSDK
jgi:LacI family transcriptional regulator